jgi:hypothetical protein
MSGRGRLLTKAHVAVELFHLGVTDRDAEDLATLFWDDVDEDAGLDGFDALAKEADDCEKSAERARQRAARLDQNAIALRAFVKMHKPSLVPGTAIEHTPAGPIERVPQ